MMLLTHVFVLLDSHLFISYAIVASVLRHCALKFFLGYIALDFMLLHSY